MRLAKAALVLAVLLAIAMPAVASEVTIAGWARYGCIIPVNAADVTKHAVYARMYATYKVDDFNTFTLQFFNNDPVIVASIGATATSTIADNVYIYYAYDTINLAKWLKLDASGLGLTLIAGKLWQGDAGYGNVTQSGWEDTSVTAAGAPSWGLAANISYKTLFTLELADIPVTKNDYYVGLYTAQTGDWGALNAEVSYDGNAAATLADGVVALGANYSKAFGDITPKVGAGFNYNLGAATYAWNAGIRVTHKTLGLVSVAAYGKTGATFNLLIADFAINAIKNMGILGTVKLNFATGEDLFNTLDAAVRLDVGAADIYLGYFLGQSALWAPVAFTTTATDRAAHSGPYVKVDISY